LSHDRGAVTVGNEVPAWQDRCLGQSRLFPPGPDRRPAALRHHRWPAIRSRLLVFVWGWW